LEEFHGAKVVINFWIVKGERDKIAAQGQISFTMVVFKTGRPTRVPEDIIAHYQV
jgi:acyl-CoA thioesterase FadM